MHFKKIVCFHHLLQICFQKAVNMLLLTIETSSKKIAFCFFICALIVLSISLSQKTKNLYWQKNVIYNVLPFTVGATFTTVTSCGFSPAILFRYLSNCSLQFFLDSYVSHKALVIVLEVSQRVILAHLQCNQS